jgi:hypothetical protein
MILRKQASSHSTREPLESGSGRRDPAPHAGQPLEIVSGCLHAQNQRSSVADLERFDRLCSLHGDRRIGSEGGEDPGWFLHGWHSNNRPFDMALTAVLDEAVTIVNTGNCHAGSCLAGRRTRGQWIQLEMDCVFKIV